MLKHKKRTEITTCNFQQQGSDFHRAWSVCIIRESISAEGKEISSSSIYGLCPLIDRSHIGYVLNCIILCHPYAYEQDA